MNSYIEVMAIVEGKTEQIFIEGTLAPYLGEKKIFMHATQVTKPGQKGGDVRFSRVKNDLELHLKQRPDTFVTTFLDYYGVKEWPAIDAVPPNATPSQIACVVNNAAKAEVVACFAAQEADRRFIPYMAIHEFEALLFSDSAVLASKLGIAEECVTAILTDCGEPEAINNNQLTAPSKRLNMLLRGSNKSFKKTSTGIDVAKAIGIVRMREECPLFNTWIEHFEAIVGGLG